jgi:hypothetical protein
LPPSTHARVCALHVTLIIGSLPAFAAGVETQATYTWATSSAVTSTNWLNSSNWTGGSIGHAPGTDSNTSSTIDGNDNDVARFTTWGSGSAIGINMGASLNTGVGSDTAANTLYRLGAIDYSGQTRNLAIGIPTSSSSATGTLRLNGATVNTGAANVANTLLAVTDSASTDLTIQNTIGTTPARTNSESR